MMRKFSAQYIFTNTGQVLKRGLITTEDDGTITRIDETGGKLTETGSTEFYNGIIIPGFINCHCHLELSHMKNTIPPGNGLAEFIRGIRNQRAGSSAEIATAIQKADNEMSSSGIVLCADICNTSDTFDIKLQSGIRYLNLIEVFGIDPDRAPMRLNEAERLAELADTEGLPWCMVPHSVYSLSLPLLALVRNKTLKNKVTSIHFMESEAEIEFLQSGTGTLVDYYRESGLLPQEPQPVQSHSSAILNEITGSGNLILVHCTHADIRTIKEVSGRKNLYWCLCPNSNNYIENHLPPVDLFIKEGCKIILGTDSLASNRHLSILSEMINLQDSFPSVTLDELVKWATLNGAEALGEENLFGSLEPGKKPGLLLLENIDLQALRLLPDTSVKRLI
jgi:cytosine/adenosine deaminase-related metal-dependent hydrolase